MIFFILLSTLLVVILAFDRISKDRDQHEGELEKEIRIMSKKLSLLKKRLGIPSGKRISLE